MIVLTVGRGRENNIVIDDEKVSRTHLQMVQDDKGNVFVVDLNATNGTFVNGNRIAGEVLLKAGDKVRIGNTLLPWQDYFKPHQSPTESGTPAQPQSQVPKQRPRWLLIAGVILAAILIMGGVLLLTNNKKNTEKENSGQGNEEQYEQIISAMGQDYSDEKKNRELAEENARIAERAKKAAEEKSAKTEKEKEAEVAQAVQEKDAAVKRAEAAEKEKKEKMNAQQKAEDAAKDAKEKADKEVANAKAAAKDAKEKADKEVANAKTAVKDAEQAQRLTINFYEELNKARNKNKLAAVCEALNITDRGSAEKQYERIVDEFKKAKDNTSREDIIEKVKKKAE